MTKHETAAPPTWGLTQRDILIALAMALTALVLYAPALSGMPIIDDGAYVFAQPRMGHVSPGVTPAQGLARTWTGYNDPAYGHQFYPLTSTGFWLLFRLFGMHPTGYHVVNVLLHVINSILVWRLFERLRVPGSLAIGFVFLVHPVHVQSVAWIAELKNVQSLCFFMLSVHVALSVFHLADDRDESAPDSGSQSPPFNTAMYVVMMLLYLAALLSKTASASLPLGLASVIWWKRGNVSLIEMARLLPMLILAGLFAKLTSGKEQGQLDALGQADMVNYAGAQRLLMAGEAVVRYFGKLVWPHPLTFHYPRWALDAGDAWQWLWPIGVAVTLLVLLALRKRIGRGPFAASAFFVVAVAPVYVTNVALMRISFVADHWQYWSDVAMIALLVGGGAWFAKKLQAKDAQLRVAAVVVVVALSIITLRTTPLYRSMFTVYTQNLEYYPDNWLAHYNLAVWAYKHDDPDAAVAHYEVAVETNPQDAFSLRQIAEIRAEQQRHDEAAAWFARLLAVDPDDTDAKKRLAQEHFNAGVWQVRHDGNASAALSHFERALEIAAPADRVQFTFMLAWLRATAPDPAIYDGEAALKLIDQLPADAPLRLPRDIVRAAALARSGNFEQAAALAQTVASDPGRFGPGAAQLAARHADLYRSGKPLTVEP